MKNLTDHKLLLITLVIFLVLAAPTLALEKAGYTFNLVRDGSDYPSKVLERIVEPRYYTPTGITQFDLTFTMKKNTVGDVDYTRSDFGYYFKEFRKENPFTDIKVSYLGNQTFYYDRPIEECWPVGNTTECSVIGYDSIEDWHMIWKKIPATIPIKSGQLYAVNIRANTAPTLESWSVDIVPILKTIVLEEFAWWNNDFTSAMNITIDNTGNANALTNFVMFFNVTYDGDMKVDFTDLRFINDSVDGAANAIELDYFWLQVVSGSWGIVGVEVDYIPASSTRLISTYFKNAGASSTQNGTDTFFSFDHYDGAFDTNIWSIQAGTPIVSNSIVECEAQTSFRTIWNYQYNIIIGGNCSFETNAGIYWSGWGLNKAQDTERAMFFMTSNNNWSNTRTGGSENNTIISDFTTPVDTYDWHIFEIRRPVDNSFIEYRIDFHNESNHTIDIPVATDGGLAFINHPAGDSGVSMFCDWVYIENNTYPRPTYSFGAKQSGGADEWGTPTFYANQSSSPSNYNPNVQTTMNVTFNTTTLQFNYSQICHNASGSWGCSETTRANDNRSTYQLVSPATTYQWYMGANDSVNGDWRYTLNYTITVNSNSTTSCSQTFVESSPINYGTALTARCSCQQLEGTTYMYQNTTNVTGVNNTGVVYGVGSYDYVCNVTQSQNYTAETDSDSFTINRANPTYYSWIGGILNTNSSTFPLGTNVTTNQTIFTLTGECVVATCFNTYWIERTGDWKVPAEWNGLNPTNYEWLAWNNTLTAGDYYFKSNTTQTQNYSSSEIIYEFTIGSALTINVLEENTLNDIVFNITLYNSTFSITEYNTNLFTSNASNVPYGVVTVNYWTTTHPQRTYYTVLTNASNESIVLYLYATGLTGQYVSFYTLNAQEALISNAEITMKRLINSTDTIVAQQRTDASGVATMYLDYTYNYDLDVYAVGYNIVNTSLTPTQTAYKIYLTTNTSFSYSAMFDDINYSLTPLGPLNNNTNYTFVYSLTSSNSSLEWFGWNFTNGTVIHSNNTTGAAGGTLTFTLNTSEIGGNFTLTIYFKKTSYDPLYLDFDYYVYNVNASTHSIIGIAERNIAGDLDITPEVFGILSIIATAIAAGFGSQFIKQIGGGVLGLSVLGLFTFLGTFMFGLAYWFGWLLFMMTALIIGSYYWTLKR